MNGFGRFIAAAPAHPVTAEAAAHMRMRRQQNKARPVPLAEQWMAEKLAQAGFKFNHQCLWMTRIFDFWNHELGCAVEVDGPEHDREKDARFDAYMFFRSEIVVIRVPNFDEAAASAALVRISELDKWEARRAGPRYQEIYAACASKRKRLLTELMDQWASGLAPTGPG